MKKVSWDPDFPTRRSSSSAVFWELLALLLGLGFCLVLVLVIWLVQVGAAVATAAAQGLGSFLATLGTMITLIAALALSMLIIMLAQTPPLLLPFSPLAGLVKIAIALMK